MHNISILLSIFRSSHFCFPYLDHHTYILEDVILFIYFYLGLDLGGSGGGWGVSSLPIVTHVHCTEEFVQYLYLFLICLKRMVEFDLLFSNLLYYHQQLQVFGFREHIAFEESQI